MKKVFLFWMLFVASMTVSAQGNSGLGFNFQAVVRGADGSMLRKQNVELRFSLMPGQQAQQGSWVETHSVVTDDFGTVQVTVGKGARTGGVAAEFTDVNFASVYHWLKVEIKEGAIYRELSYTALQSVPYAEVASNVVGFPVGAVIPFAGDASKIPAGWLLCNGDPKNRSDYPALFDVIGTAWGAPNSTTFNLPDMQGVFLRGVSGNSGRDNTNERTPMGSYSKENVGSYQEDVIRNITGTLSVVSSANTGGSGGIVPYTYTGVFAGTTPSRPAYVATAESNTSSAWLAVPNIYFDASRSVGEDHVGSDNRPKNVYVHYIIKY